MGVKKANLKKMSFVCVIDLRYNIREIRFGAFDP